MKILSIALLAFSVVCTPASEAQERKAPVPELKRGGYVILFRHGETDRSLLPREQRKPEPAPMDLANCAMQAKLTENGRDDARVIGRAFTTLGIPVGKVLASGYCRTMETARLAFGHAEASDMLLHPAYVPASGAPIPPAYSQRREALRQFLATPSPSGTNTVLVSHGEIFRDLIGSEGATGEGLIYKSDGQGGFTLVERVLPESWLAKGRP
jgi:broad specificity phosphatase PhoE